VEDVAAMRLVLDNLQAQQAKKELQGAEDVLLRVARECYKWLLCPAQHNHTDAKPIVEVYPLNTVGASLGSEIERVCIDTELVITTWSPIHLRDELKKLYWKPDKSFCSAMEFWEDTLRYLFLPRLKTCSVLEQAIIKGAGSKDFYGTAYGLYEGVFEGFKFGDANVQLDDTLLLIESGAAKKYEEEHAPKPPLVPLAGILGEGTPPLNNPAGSSQVGPGTIPPTTGVTKSKTFIGTADVSAATARIRLLEIAEEIISVLASDPTAKIQVSVEISADFPEGVSDQIKRAVSENASSLGFKNKTWE